MVIFRVLRRIAIGDAADEQAEAIVRVRAAMPASIVLPNIQFCSGPTGGIW